jgi:hypothetical protein
MGMAALGCSDLPLLAERSARGARRAGFIHGTCCCIRATRKRKGSCQRFVTQSLPSDEPTGTAWRRRTGRVRRDMLERGRVHRHVGRLW